MTNEDDYPHIRGWGIDADTRNDPTYPMKVRKNGELTEPWPRPRQQGTRIEVLSSNERTEMPATFGTATPPSGVSGGLRRAAFKYSESNLLHWAMLLIADRINMIEGLFSDLGRGHIPNIPKERGWRAEWRHEPGVLIWRLLIVAGVTAATVAYLRSRRRTS